ncbi:MAG: hypothetical protein OEZ22_07270 [Spirochaetia bacterium]|nr:hypothetical protein [Spirochaetia bacterium]
MLQNKKLLLFEFAFFIFLVSSVFSIEKPVNKIQYIYEIEKKITGFESTVFLDFAYSPYISDFAEKEDGVYKVKSNLELKDILLSRATTILLFETDEKSVPIWYLDGSGKKTEFLAPEKGFIMFSGGSKNNYMPFYFSGINNELGMFKAKADNTIQIWKINQGVDYGYSIYLSGIVVTGIGLGSLLWGFISEAFRPEAPAELQNSKKYTYAEIFIARTKYNEEIETWENNRANYKIIGAALAAAGAGLMYYGIKLQPHGILIQRKF